MKKKTKKVTSKHPKGSTKKVVAKKKPAPKAKKAKPSAKKPAPKKKPVNKKTPPKRVVKKAVTPASRPLPKTAPDKKLIQKKILKLGLKPLPKALPSQVKDEKKPKGFYTLEYMVNSSPDVLFEFVSTAGGLEKWFAEKVSVKDNIFHFFWGKDEIKEARLIALKEREFARFQWVDQPDNKKYFEFRIQIDDLTSEVALIVSDFADTPEEHEDARLLWNAQIQDLLHALGGGAP